MIRIHRSAAAMLLGALLAACAGPTTSERWATAGPLPLQYAQHMNVVCEGQLSERAPGTWQLSTPGTRCHPNALNVYNTRAKAWCEERQRGTFGWVFEGSGIAIWCEKDGKAIAGFSATERTKAADGREVWTLVFTDGAASRAAGQARQQAIDETRERHKAYVASAGMTGTVTLRDGKTYPVARMGTRDASVDYCALVKPAGADIFSSVCLSEATSLEMSAGTVRVTLADGKTVQGAAAPAVMTNVLQVSPQGALSRHEGEIDPNKNFGTLTIIALVSRKDGSFQYARFDPRQVTGLSLRRATQPAAPAYRMAEVDAAAERAARAWIEAKRPRTLPASFVYQDERGNVRHPAPAACRLAYMPLSTAAYCGMRAQGARFAEERGYWQAGGLAVHLAGVPDLPL